MESKITRCKVIHKPPAEPFICFEFANREDADTFRKLEDKRLDNYVLIVKKPKSLTANNYMWQLCEKIARKTGLTKDDIYRQAIREVGAFTEGVFSREDAEQIERTWGEGHIGWFTERYDGMCNTVAMRLYHGSSLYSGEQMSRLVDFVVDEAKSLGIETLPPAELERLNQLWQQMVT
jgi:hypothetical protein